MPLQNDNPDPQLREYLKKILFSIFVSFAWLWSNMILGFFLGWAFAPASLFKQICFFTWLSISSAALFLFYLKIWRKDNKAD